MALPRLVNGERKIVNVRQEKAGKLLLFCEGATEYNYFYYFKKYIDNNTHARTSDVVIEPINVEGNAKLVYEYAENFLQDEENARKYLHYEKHLIFDCDAPEDIQDVLLLMSESANEYVLSFSNLLFETWLAMHFQDLEPGGENEKKIYDTICQCLGILEYGSKEKVAEGTIGQILGSNRNERIRAAIKNAKTLEMHWKESDKDYKKHITEMNPTAEVYKLVERLLDEVMYWCR